MPPPPLCQPPPQLPALGARRLGAACAAATTAVLVEGRLPLALHEPGHLEMRLRLTHQFLKAQEALCPLQLHDKHYHSSLLLPLLLEQRALVESCLAPLFS